MSYLHPQSAAGPGDNEYFRFASEHHFGDLFREHSNASENWRAREIGRAKYAWAIPNEEALAALLALCPLIELAAGCGYWTHLLRERGGNVVAYDACPPRDERHRNGWCKRTDAVETKTIGRIWTTVLTGRVRKPLIRHPHRTLFLCWPPYNDPFAHVALRNYSGGSFAYVGERDGCTADDGFRRLLEMAWEETREVPIPQWEGLHDVLTIWKRKEVP